MRILLIDDDKTEFALIFRALETQRPDAIQIHWAPTVLFGVDMLEVLPNNYFNFVFVDVMGTTLNWHRDIKLIKHPETYIVSSIAMILEDPQKRFKLKTDMIPFILDQYVKVKDRRDRISKGKPIQITNDKPILISSEEPILIKSEKPSLPDKK